MTNKDKKEKIEKRLFEISAKAIIMRDDKVLVLKRSEGEIRHAGKSDLPGGSIEDSEAIDKSLKREVKEELGIEIEIGPVIYASDYKKEYVLDEKSGERMIVNGKGLAFLGSYKDGEIELSDEHENYEWLSIDSAIDRFDEKDEFEAGKRQALIKASEYLQSKEPLNGWKRCMADFENFKKRQADSQKDLIRYSTQSIILQVLPVIDNFHASTDHIPVSQKENPWVTGIMYIQKQLEQVLTDNGVEEIAVKEGDNFDPALHEAVSDKECKSCKSKDYKFENKIKKVVMRGYKMGDKVVRAARVIVE